MKKILVVEDSPTQLARLKFFLEGYGFQVAAAGNGKEAAALLRQEKPDLIISDVIMPEMDGYELCRFIRGEEDFKGIPLILLTALSDPADVMKALECGADNFIIKPFDEEHLLKRVQVFLINRELRRQEGVQMGLEIVFQGEKYFINSDRLQIVNLLLSTYEAAVERNFQLLHTQQELASHTAELEAQREKLRAQNEELSDLAAALSLSEGSARRQAQILSGINRIFHEALTCESEEKLGETCLAVAEELTGSEIGFLGELNREGNLDDIAISCLGREACKSQEGRVVLPKNRQVHGIYGECLTQERPVIVNDPARHPHRVGLPEGHPPINVFLGVPLKRGGRTLGMIGLANKEGGYTEADREVVETLAPVIVEAIMSKRAEEALQHSKSEWERTFDAVPDLIAIIDNQHRIVRVNHTMAEALGTTPEDLVGRFCHEVMHNSPGPPCICPHSKMLQTGEQHIAELHELGRYFLVSASPLTDEQGRLMGSVHVARDITERRRGEEELQRAKDELELRVQDRTAQLKATVSQLQEEVLERQRAEQEVAALNEGLERRVKERTAELEFANREMESFSYSVSHDLKAPLRAIQGFSRILVDEHAGGLGEEGRRLLEVIINNTRIMDNLIDDLLTLSRLSRQPLTKSQIDMAAMARQIFEQLRSQQPSRDLRITVGDLPRAWADPGLIKQVMMNLLDNAVKYTRAKEAAVIEVGGYTEDQRTVYYIKDNGVGFDERYAHKLFAVFQRLHPGTAYEGTGVGLAIVQRIAQRHGGRAWAEGKVNEGAAFYFSLPRQ